MKYKETKIERPDWCEIGVHVMVNGHSKSSVIMGYDDLSAGSTVLLRSRPGGLYWMPIDELTPIKAWQPKKGEMIVCWDDDGEFINWGIYDKGYSVIHPYNIAGIKWDHIARIPEGFVFDSDEKRTVAWWDAYGEQMEVE